MAQLRSTRSWSACRRRASWLPGPSMMSCPSSLWRTSTSVNALLVPILVSLLAVKRLALTTWTKSTSTAGLWEPMSATALTAVFSRVLLTGVRQPTTTSTPILLTSAWSSTPRRKKFSVSISAESTGRECLCLESRTTSFPNS